MLDTLIVHPPTGEVKPIRQKPDWKHISAWMFGSEVTITFHSITPQPDGTLVHRNKTYTPTEASLARLGSLVYTISQRQHNVRFTPHQSGLGWNLAIREAS